MSCVARKHVCGLPTRSDRNQALQPQKIARGLKFWIYVAAQLFWAFVLAYTYAISRNSHDAAHIMLTFPCSILEGLDGVYRLAIFGRILY